MFDRSVALICKCVLTLELYIFRHQRGDRTVMYVDNSQNCFLTDSLSLVFECKLFYPASIRFSPLYREVSTFRSRRLYLENNNIHQEPFQMILTANQSKGKCKRKPIRIQGKYMWPARSERGKHERIRSCNWLEYVIAWGRVKLRIDFCNFWKHN